MIVGAALSLGGMLYGIAATPGTLGWVAMAAGFLLFVIGRIVKA